MFDDAALKKWDMATAVASHLVKIDPQTAGWWISLAYAVGRIEGVEKAEAILLRRTLPHRPPSNVFGRCVDDSCHAAGLGSLWAFVCAVLLCGIIAARVLDEERFLSRILPV